MAQHVHGVGKVSSLRKVLHGLYFIHTPNKKRAYLLSSQVFSDSLRLFVTLVTKPEDQYVKREINRIYKIARVNTDKNLIYARNQNLTCSLENKNRIPDQYIAEIIKGAHSLSSQETGATEKPANKGKIWFLSAQC